MSERRVQPTSSLDEVLAHLEPRSASPDFTRQVIKALDEPRRHRSGASGLWAFAAVAVATVAIGVFLGSRSHPPLAEIGAERETLRQEHSELVRELESLRALARETTPKLYLGSRDDMDFVLDLSPLLDESAPAARPASLRDLEERPTFY